LPGEAPMVGRQARSIPQAPPIDLAVMKLSTAL